MRRPSRISGKISLPIALAYANSAKHHFDFSQFRETNTTSALQSRSFRYSSLSHSEPAGMPDWG